MRPIKLRDRKTTFNHSYMLLAEGPGVARGKNGKKIILKLCENECLLKISAQTIQPFGWLYATYIQMS